MTSSAPPSVVTSEPLKINIRLAKPSELPILTKMQRDMCIETEGRELKESVITNGLKKAMEQPELGARVYVATLAPSTTTDDEENNNTPIGMMMNTTEWDLHRNKTIIWFQSVFVLPEYRRRGIFKSFFAFVKNQVLQDDSACSIRLDVDCTNENAQATYRNMGMHLEGVRIVRYSKPGAEPEFQNDSAAPSPTRNPSTTTTSDNNNNHSLGNHNNNNNSFTNSHSNSTSLPLPAPEKLTNQFEVTRITKENATASLIDQIAKMQLRSSSKFFPTTFPPEGSKKSFEQTRAGIQAVIDQPEKVGAELYIAELIEEDTSPNNNNNNKNTTDSSSSSTTEQQQHALPPHRKPASNRTLIASVVLTHEWSDWRDGKVLNGFGSYAVVDEVASEMKSLRPECLRALFRSFRERTLQDDTVSGVRFAYEEEVETNLRDENDGRIDNALVEEGMFVERYYLMRFDKP